MLFLSWYNCYITINHYDPTPPIAGTHQSVLVAQIGFKSVNLWKKEETKMVTLWGMVRVV